jgi:hypothetical protein
MASLKEGVFPHKRCVADKIKELTAVFLNN